MRKFPEERRKIFKLRVECKSYLGGQYDLIKRRKGERSRNFDWSNGKHMCRMGWRWRFFFFSLDSVTLWFRVFINDFEFCLLNEVNISVINWMMIIKMGCMFLVLSYENPGHFQDILQHIIRSCLDFKTS